MESKQVSPEENPNAEIEYVVVEGKKRSPLRRVGCGIMLVFWFTVLLLPLVLFALAVNGDITISRSGDIPDSHEHPLFQASLVMEADFRGLRLTNTSLARDDDNNLCIQTNVRFLMWQGDGEASVFCDCYQRDNSNFEWELSSTTLATCE